MDTNAQLARQEAISSGRLAPYGTPKAIATTRRIYADNTRDYRRSADELESLGFTFAAAAKRNVNMHDANLGWITR